jgi:hypothetical protein
VEAQDRASRYPQGGKRGGHERGGQPPSVGGHDGGETEERDPALGQAAEVVQQRDRLADRIDASPVELVVVLRRLIEAEIEPRRLVVDEALDVVLDELGLRGAHPRRHARQNFGEKEDGGQRGRPWHHGAEITRFACPAEGLDERIDHGTDQQRQRDREQALDDHEGSPHGRPPPGRRPDQAQRSRQVRELAQGPLQRGARHVLVGH